MDEDDDTIMDSINGSGYNPTFARLVNVDSEFSPSRSPAPRYMSIPNQTAGSVSTEVCITLDFTNIFPAHKHTHEENKFGSTL